MTTETDSAGPHDWLPDHQLHVAATLAHADHLIEQVCESVRPVIRDGAVEIHDRYEGGLCFATVKSVKPIPTAVSRYTADALTQLRAVVEHTLFAEVEHSLGRALTEKEAQVIEMPAFTNADNLTNWLNDKRRKALPPLRDGSRLVKRLRELQPYNLRKRPDEHPLRLLAVHTNLAKHRAPLIAATRIGTVIPDSLQPGVEIPQPPERPARVGDVIAIAPPGVVVPMDIWPTVSIQRPHTGQYPILINELEFIADWIRTVAVPILITGGLEVAPLPVQLDTTAPWENVREVIADGGHVGAPGRFRRSIQAALAREGLRDIMAEHPEKPSKRDVRRWIASLSDDQALERVEATTPGTSLEALLRTKQLVDGWLEEIRSMPAE